MPLLELLLKTLLFHLYQMLLQKLNLLKYNISLLHNENTSQACKLTLPMRAGKRFTSNTRRETTVESQPNVPDANQATGDISHSSVGVSNRV